MGPQIRENLEDEVFVESLTDTERAAWESFKWICTNFLGRKKSPDFSDGIQKYLDAYKETGSRMSINPYPTAFPYGNGMVLHFYQQQESSTTKTVHKVINKGLKAYV